MIEEYIAHETAGCPNLPLYNFYGTVRTSQNLKGRNFVRRYKDKKSFVDRRIWQVVCLRNCVS